MNETGAFPRIAEQIGESLEKYPLMQPDDVLKFVYQSEFGPSHFCGSEEESLEAIREERKPLGYDESEALYEPVGDRFVRVNLAALDETVYPLEALNDDFVRSSAVKQGSRYAVMKKLDTILECFDELPFAFEKDELLSAIERWKAADFPAISHSMEYHKLYSPHYRVISREYVRDFLTEREKNTSRKKRIAMRIALIAVLVLLSIGMALLGHYLYYVIAP